ncbi:MAG: sulfotransferase family 2 domain-containing protein [Sedimenticolaceae bacterium]
MLLSLKHNFLFVHIAKTGGTSVRDALQPLRYRDPYYSLQWLCSRLSGMTSHRLGIKFPRHAKVIAAKEMLPQELFERLFKFAFVRNPWDLQVSSFHHIRRERPHLMAHIETFDQFLRWKLDPARAYQYQVDTSIELQSDYVVDLHGQLLVDFLGHYETLPEDFAEACRRIGIVQPALPHRRQANDRGQDYRGYYSDDLAALVAQHFEPDIRRFGYRFDPPPAAGNR